MKWFLKSLAAALFVSVLAVGAVAAPEPPWNNATNCSGTITAGGTAQVLIPSGSWHGFEIFNLSGARTLGISEFTSTPVVGAAGTRTLATSTPGSFYRTPDTYAPAKPVYIIGSTTGDAFTCVVW